MITDREKIIAIVDNDCLMHSDAAILLEGDGFFRFQKAVDLYKRGLVDRIVFSGNIIDKDYGSFPYEEVAPFILNQGVPEKDLIHEDQSQHTRQQAIEVVKMAMEKGWTKLALVASHEHQYRAYLTFLREVLDTKSGILERIGDVQKGLELYNSKNTISSEVIVKIYYNGNQAKQDFRMALKDVLKGDTSLYDEMTYFMDSVKTK